MSMTKRYLESLPAHEQDEILGGYYAEWTDSAENEPTDEELAEWALALIEEEDEEANDPPVRCRICRAERPISQMNTNGECPPCQREVALMVKPEGPCVRLEDNNGIEWKL